MKLRIMQQGGGLIYTPFIPGAQGATTTTSSSNTSDSESKIDALDKELIALMKGQDLLPSDIDRITKSLITFQKRASQYAAVGDYSSVMPGVYQIQAEVLKAQAAKKQSDIVTQRMAKENAGSEVALDTYGRMYVQDKEGNVTKVTTSEFDEEKYHPISNSELLYYRQVSAADNGQIFNDLGNMVGMETVQSQLSDIIDNFGTIKGDRFETAKMRNIAEDIAKGDSVFKITEKYSKADLTDFSGLLLSQLSRDAQYRIKANAKLIGISDKDYVRKIIDSRTSPEISTDYEASMTKAIAGDDVSGDAKNLKEYSYVERLAANQNAGLPVHLSLNKNGSSVDMDILAFNQGPIVKDKEENSIGAGMLSDIRNDAYGLNQVATQDSVQFGNQMFSKSSQDTIYYDNSTMYSAKLPWTTDKQGNIMVDYAVIDLLDKLNERRKNGDLADLTPEMLERVLKESDPRLYINEAGEIAWVDSKWFIGFEAYTANNFENDLDTSSPWVTKVSSSEENRIREKFETANKYGYVDINKSSKEKAGRSRKQGQFIINWRNHDLYKSYVWMPITRNMAGSTEYYPAASHMDNYNTAMAAQKQEQVRQELITGARKTTFNR